MPLDGVIKRWIVSARRAAIDPLDAEGLRLVLERSDVRIVEPPSPDMRRPRALVDGTADAISQLRSEHGHALLASEDSDLSLFPSTGRVPFAGPTAPNSFDPNLPTPTPPRPNAPSSDPRPSEPDDPAPDPGDPDQDQNDG